MLIVGRTYITKERFKQREMLRKRLKGKEQREDVRYM